MNWKKIGCALTPVGVGLVLAAVPAPAGLEPNAWRYFALFVGVIAGLILEPLPASVIGILGITLGVTLGLVDSDPKAAAEWGLSGFSNRTVWLIFSAFVISLGYQKSGLGRRIAFNFVKRLGHSTLGLGYAIALADLMLALGVPSNTARSGGTIYPILRSIPPLFDSEPGPTARRIGGYLMWTAFAATAVTSSMFLTSIAPNPVAAGLVSQGVQFEITWMMWWLGFLPIGALLLALVPWLTYIVYPPEISASKEVPEWAGRQLEELGPPSRSEIHMSLLILLTLVLWVFGGDFINATTVALIAVSLMIILRIIDWSDVLSHTKAWDVLVWFATLVTLANGLKQVGFVDWAAQNVAYLLSGYSALMAMVLLVVFFYVIHYMFASVTAHTVALLPVVLAVGAQTPGVPIPVFALLLCYSLGLMGILTPYATGPAPVYYGSGFITRKEFWRLGMIFGFVYLVVLLAIGVPYLLLLQGRFW